MAWWGASYLELMPTAHGRARGRVEAGNTDRCGEDPTAEDTAAEDTGGPDRIRGAGRRHSCAHGHHLVSMSACSLL